jgi:hypothetical protein
MEILSLVKNTKFMRLWLSQVVSQIVVNMLSFLILIRLFEITHSTIASSLIWVAYSLPAIIIGPIAAVTADLVDKRKALILSLLAQSIVVALYSVLYARFVFLAYGIVFLYSFFNQFYVPAEAASLPLLVKPGKLPYANSLFFVTVQAGLAGGFLIAGILYEYVGFGLSMVLSSLLLLLACFSVSLLPTLRPSEHIPKGFSKGFSSFFGELIEGYSFITKSKRVLFPFLLLVGLQVSLSVIVITLPAISTEIVRVKPSLSGVVVIIPTAIGALISTYLVSKALANGIAKKLLIRVSLLSLAASLFVLGAVVLRSNFWLGRSLSVICFIVAGASYVGTLIPTLTHLQISTPKGKLGRVFGNIWFITTAITVIPVLFSATITEIFGAPLLLIILSIYSFSMFMAVELYLPGLFKDKVIKLISR